MTRNLEKANYTVGTTCRALSMELRNRYGVSHVLAARLSIESVLLEAAADSDVHYAAIATRAQDSISQLLNGDSSSQAEIIRKVYTNDDFYAQLLVNPHISQPVAVTTQMVMADDGLLRSLHFF